MNGSATASPRRLALLAAGAAVMAAVGGPAHATTSGVIAPGTYPLKDGTTLFVAQNGRMRMFTAEGQRLHMEDGVLMETRDGKVVAMKEDLNWKQLRRFGTLSPKTR